MWGMTVDGFISIVDKDGREHLCVRARERETLVSVCRRVDVGLDQIVTGGGTDYAYRVWLTRGEVAEYLTECVYAIEYDNFKTEVARVKGRRSKYVEFLSKVWSAGWEVLGKP